MKIEIDDNHISFIKNTKKTNLSVEEIINQALHDQIIMRLLNDVDQLTLANLKFKTKRIGELIKDG